jgi:mono/diheme cytochrome c family protein
MRKILMFMLLLPALAAAQSGTGNVENGKRVFVKDGCSGCHGTVGEGGQAGARLGPPRLSAPALIAYVRRPGGQMPAFSEKVLSNSDLTDIYAYLKSIPEPKAVKDIPLLDGARNQ